MPNGGTDNCMICEFNTNNRKSHDIEIRKSMQEIHEIKDKEARTKALTELFGESDTFKSGHCRIRDFEIERAPYTYCANHDYRNPERHDIPVGPAFEGDSYQNRWIVQLSPDSASIRERLLQLLSEVNMTPAVEYRPGYSMWEMAIYQVGLFRDRRAVPDLERIAKLPLDVSRSNPDEHPHRNPLIYLARWALKVMDTPPEQIIGKRFESTVEMINLPGDPVTDAQ